MKRSLVTVAVAMAAAIALIGVLATSSNAQSSHRPATIRFTLVRVGGFFPRGQPKPGMTFGSVQTVTGDDGSKGSADVLCTFITANAQFCNVQFNLSTGTLAFQGIAHRVNNNAPFTVIGGTGAYAVARGSATVNDVTETTTRFTVTLPSPDD
jgi:hypothetical protein